MSTPCISVIVPVYNTEKYLHECINSILNQTFTHIQLILVDDGSPDNCGKICDEYAAKDSRVRVFHQENGGVCVARNTGLDNATGDYIFFVDSDDYLPEDAIETLYNDSVENNADISVGLMFSDTATINTDNHLEVWKEKQGLVKVLEDNPALYGCANKLYKRSLIEDVCFVPGKKVHEDGYFLFLALIKLPTITVREKCTYIYRYNSNSASNAMFSDKYFDVLYFEELTRNTICEKFPEFTELAYNKLVKAHITMLQLFCKTKDKKYNQDIKTSVRMVRKYSKYYFPAIPGEEKFFYIVKYGGYPIFRKLYWIKYRKELKK